MTSFLEKYIQQLQSQYPTLTKTLDLEKSLEFLVSEHVLTLPLSAYRHAAEAVHDIYAYAHSANYISQLQLSAEEQVIFNAAAKNHSVLMAYDFHYDLATHKLSLIEVNTNASAFLLSAALYELNTTTPLNTPWGDPHTQLQESFAEEASFRPKTNVAPKVAIIDENPPAQKMYTEFLMYRDLFNKWGWAAEIFNYDSVDFNSVDFVYNRLNDFLLTNPKSKSVLGAYLDGRCVLSPNPKEYLLLADKKRLINFAMAKISDTLIPTYDVASYTDKEDLWLDRKKLFFKPKNLYGGKAAYRGSSISRNVFQSTINDDFIAQEYRPAGTWQGFKFDLRFYVYKDKIQLVVARLYNGQVTNFSTLGGGLARVQFN